MKSRSEPGQGQSGTGKIQRGADQYSLAASGICITYPGEQCPFCEQRPGKLPGICHLLPSKSDPVSVFIYFQACVRCDRRTRNATGKAREKISIKTVRYFDNWLELEYGQKRAAA